MPAAVPATLFVADADRFVPTELARGPWDPDALHGGPIAALAARAIESVDGGEAFFVTRMTLEILRPVPLASALAVRARVTRPGRRVQIVECEISAGETPVTAVRAVRIRRGDVAVPGVDIHEPLPLPDTLPTATPATGRFTGLVAFHSHGVEVRNVRGAFDDLGPATAWFRLTAPVVAGEEPSPLQRVVACADFGNGLSRVVDFDRYLFINPDLTVQVERDAVGEWICLDSVSTLRPIGVGMAQSALSDRDGPIGRALQSLLVESR